MTVSVIRPSAAPSTEPRPATTGPARSRWTSRRIRNVAVWYVVVAAISIVAIYPFLMMISTSLKSDAETAEFPPSLVPESWQWSNFLTALSATDFVRQLGNSLIYALGSMIANVVLCALAGYAFAKMRFPGRTVIFAGVIALLMVPAQSQIVPVFIVLQHIPLAGGNNLLGMGGSGLLNTYAGLIMPSVATPLGIFLMRQFFAGVPDEYLEAARLDGASHLRIFASIMVPLSTPAVATLGILSFQSAWNDFVWPLILTTDTDLATLQLGLQLYSSGQESETNILMAASTLTVIPMIILFLAAQRYFVGGLAAGLKG